MGTESATRVVGSVSVPTRARTFELFTTRMTDFWPNEYSIGSSTMAEVVIEPGSGGRWFERGIDGSEYQCGRVASWDPPREVLLFWQIGAELGSSGILTRFVDVVSVAAQSRTS